MVDRDVGVLYVAVGEPFLAQATVSARSLKEKNDLPVVLATPSPAHADVSVFDSTIKVNGSEPHLAKIKAIASFPFQRTVFIDADTYVCTSIEDAFDVLNGVHIAGVRQPGYRPQDGIPRAFPEINTGFLVYEKCDQVHALFDDWAALAGDTKQGQVRDQWAFRKVLFEHREVRFAHLGSEFNVLLNDVAIVRYGARVLHGSGFDFESIAKAINARGSTRLWFPSEKKILDSREFWDATKNAREFERFRWKT